MPAWAQMVSTNEKMAACCRGRAEERGGIRTVGVGDGNHPDVHVLDDGPRRIDNELGGCRLGNENESQCHEQEAFHEAVSEKG